MKYVLANPKKYGTHQAIKIADANVGVGTDFETYPLYALGFFGAERKPNVVQMVDVGNIRVPEE